GPSSSSSTFRRRDGIRLIGTSSSRPARSRKSVPTATSMNGAPGRSTRASPTSWERDHTAGVLPLTSLEASHVDLPTPQWRPPRDEHEGDDHDTARLTPGADHRPTSVSPLRRQDGPPETRP